SLRRPPRSSTPSTTPWACGSNHCRLPERRSWPRSRASPEEAAMKGFDLHEPTSLGEAVSLLNQLGANGKVLAGGGALVGGVLKDWVTGKGMPLPSALVDITALPELKGIKVDGSGVTIGATTTLSEVIESADVQKTVPMLSDAAKTIASPLIRNFGTLGG